MSQFLFGSSNNAESASGNVKETTTQEFKADVIDASMQQPVLVDFWAPWCGPCRQLGPALEKVVEEQAGKVRLVKMNIDEHPEVAGQLGVRSIPAVFAFVDGRPVDGFMGALPEGELRSFVQKLLKGDNSEIEALLEQAEEALGQGDVQTAANAFAGVMQAERDNARAYGGLVRTLVAAGNVDRAEQMLATVPENMANAPEIAQARQALALAREGDEASNEIGDLEARIRDNPDDFEARLHLAKAYNAVGEKEKAIDTLLHIQRKAPDWNDGEARRQLLAFFEAWGPKDPMTALGRRRLSSILFS